MIISSQSKVSNLNIQTSTLNLDGKVLHQIDNISYLITFLLVISC